MFQKLNKGVSTPVSIVIIVIVTLIVVGGVFAYQHYFNRENQYYFNRKDIGEKEERDVKKLYSGDDLVYSDDKNMSAYIKVNKDIEANKAVSEVHLLDYKNNTDKVLEKYECRLTGAGSGICPLPCRVKGFSPGSKYIVLDCGTSPTRTRAVIDVVNGGESVSFQSYGGEIYWLNETEVLFHKPQGCCRPWEDGMGMSIAKLDIANNKEIVLKKADNLNDYSIKQVLDNGNILYIKKTSLSSDYNDWLNAVSTEWIMDQNGNIIKQVSDKTTNWKTYKSNAYGFEIQYPNNMSIQNSSNGVSLVSADNQRKIDIKVESIEPGQDCRKTTWAADVPNKTIDNTMFVGVGSGLKDEPYYGVMYCTIRNGFDYMITLHLLHVSGGPNNFPEDDAVLNQILSTFKFTK